MKPFQCRTCREVLGVTDGAILVIGLVRIEDALTLHCLGCQDSRTWRPLTRGTQKEARQARNALRRLAFPVLSEKR